MSFWETKTCLVPNFCLNVYKCKEKWRNMKIVLKRHLRKGVIKRRRKYYLFDYLRFVIPFMKVVNPEIYGQSSNINEEMEKYTITSDPLPEATENNPPELSATSPTSMTCFDSQNHVSLIDHTYNNDSMIQNQFEYHIPVHSEDNSRIGKVSEATADTKESYIELNNNRKKQEEEAKKAFLMSLLPDLNLMNGQQTRYFKKRVLEAVDEILDEAMPNQ
ncbi:uncharacterized protein LOC123671513 isoform X2 [Harmonia axyridis]|uniref:uncharacterized protein LOC123671513 isoform X2 n=1 Tax=Harmonia axyridis TaxID=115357 RepID=UPI001E27549F|nr:uncharacterized protein LOC123671513 isoform X2 [Harmonia axyridis]